MPCGTFRAAGAGIDHNSAPSSKAREPPMPDTNLLDEIKKAADRLKATAVTTPLLESALVNDRVGGRLIVKAECLQHTGSFKFRGAFNRLSLIPAAHRDRGVVAYSSGNHAQGVAAAARLLGIAATIVMPASAPDIKKARTRAFGARVVEYDPERESREVIGAAIAAESGATLVRPYDDPGVIAGQGTVGLEIAADLADRGIVPDQLLCPCGGGGLIAGVSTALLDTFADCAVYSAEPDGFDDTARSLEAGRRVSNSAVQGSICDAIVTPEPGEITFPINRRNLAAGLTAGDDEVLHAMRIAFEDFKIVAEPGGAVALAAALAGRLPLENRCTVVVCSGGNVDASLFARCLR